MIIEYVFDEVLPTNSVTNGSTNVPVAASTELPLVYLSEVRRD